MIYVGTLSLGRTDQIPGLFLVKTTFFHIDFIPLVPIESHLVLEGELEATLSAVAARAQQSQEDFRNPRARSLAVLIRRDSRRSPRTGPRPVIKIPLSRKSVALAWIRFIMTLLSISSFAVFILSVSDHPIDPTFAGLSLLQLAIVGVLASWCMYGKTFRHATYERATELSTYLPRELAGLAQNQVNRWFAEKEGCFPIADQNVEPENPPRRASANEKALTLSPNELELANATKDCTGEVGDEENGSKCHRNQEKDTL
mmetsp:Transcript_28337/g.47022  ORF Transcript_28337/g.47022 Transcript_28337/m.47022 type:complete len:258 (+) Transcript_28337:161-934(+)